LKDNQSDNDRLTLGSLAAMIAPLVLAVGFLFLSREVFPTFGSLLVGISLILVIAAFVLIRSATKVPSAMFLVTYNFFAYSGAALTYAGWKNQTNQMLFMGVGFLAIATLSWAGLRLLRQRGSNANT